MLRNYLVYCCNAPSSCSNAASNCREALKWSKQLFLLEAEVHFNTVELAALVLPVSPSVFFCTSSLQQSKPVEQIFLYYVTDVSVSDDKGVSFPFKVVFKGKGSPWLLNAESNVRIVYACTCACICVYVVMERQFWLYIFCTHTHAHAERAN